MQWFKHDTASTQDAKMRKLILRYGPVGYAVYFHCIELIAGDTSENNVTFELEHDAEIIADDLKVKGTTTQSAVEVVEEIMRYAVDLNLFENASGKIFCFKLLKRLDSSMTSSPTFRKMIASAKTQNHATVMTGSGQGHDVVMQEENRIEQKRKKRTKTVALQLPDFIDPESWAGYVEMRKKIKAPMTDRAMTLALNKLEKMERPNQVLDQSTQNGWKGLFDVPPNNSGFIGQAERITFQQQKMNNTKGAMIEFAKGGENVETRGQNPVRQIDR